MVDGHLAARPANAGRVMIRVSHIALPPGLNVLARREADGELVVLVSTALSPDRQRAAVRTALRAVRRADGRAALLPLPVVAFLAASWAWLRAMLRACRAHWGWTSAVAAATAAAVVLFAVVLPHGHQPASAGRGPGHSRVQGSAPRTGAKPPAPSRRAGSTASPSPASHATPTPSGSVRARTPSSSPSPQPSPSSTPAPSPSSSTPAPGPSPSPSASSSPGDCVHILGIWVCL
jgi:hypothetical protein